MVEIPNIQTFSRPHRRYGSEDCTDQLNKFDFVKKVKEKSLNKEQLSLDF